MSELVEVKTIGEVERIVHASGLWDGTGPVEFSDDGTVWTEAWAPTPDPVNPELSLVGHPTYARVEVYRKDVRIPTKVTIRWDEQVPAASNPEAQTWADKWARSPMRHFGRTARMVAFRQTFRELLGNIVIEDEDRASAPVEPPTLEVRDWAAEFAAAESVEQLEKIVAAARSARVFKPNATGTALDRQWKKLHAELSEDPWESAPGPSPESQGPATPDQMQALEESLARAAAARRPAPELSEDEAIRSRAFFDQPEERPVIRNRADRRAAARKKGHRR